MSCAGQLIINEKINSKIINKGKKTLNNLDKYFIQKSLVFSWVASVVIYSFTTTRH